MFQKTGRSVAIRTMLHHIIPKVAGSIEHENIPREFIFTLSRYELRYSTIRMVEIACAILHEYRHKCYAREAVAAMTKWAFQNEDVYYIMAEEARDGMAAERALTRLGFRPTERFGEEGRYYEIERPFVSNLKTMMSLGVTFGLLLGAVLVRNLTAGTLIGAAAGYAVGSILDAKERKKRENLRQMRR